MKKTTWEPNKNHIIVDGDFFLFWTAIVQNNHGHEILKSSGKNFEATADFLHPDSEEF